jgi:hypothetical protein
MQCLANFFSWNNEIEEFEDICIAVKDVLNALKI